MRNHFINSALAAGVVLLTTAGVVAQDDTGLVTCQEDVERPRCGFSQMPIALDGLIVELDGRDLPFQRTQSALTFIDAAGRVWTAPKATLTDGASIPSLFVPMVGAPTSDTFLPAAVIHDAFCGIGNEDLEEYHSVSWEDTHRVFYDALIAGGTSPLRAKIMFAAVYLGGPRWDDPERMLDVAQDRLVQEMAWCIEFIERGDPSREELVEWMRSREELLIGPEHTEPNWDVLLAK